MDAVLQLITSASSLDEKPNENGMWAVQVRDDDQPRWVARTMPNAAGSRGYRGPTEALLVMDENDVITAVGVLHSHDTDEHVTAVEADAKFLSQFVGLTWNAVDQKGNTPQVDGVSGATLTSLAMAEGIFARLGKSSSGSLLFDQPLQPDEFDAELPPEDFEAADPVAVVRDETGTLQYVVIRSGPFSDDVIGYQGPTELLISVDPTGTVQELRIRKSLDNEPYVDYVRDEASFWNTFRGKTLGELAHWDPVADGVEGVSGATMTSLAIADSMPKIAKEIESLGGLDRWTQPPPAPWSWESIAGVVSKIRVTSRDVCVIGMLGLLWLLTAAGVMRRRRLRTAWLMLVVITIGLWTGNLISLSLIMGWASSGVCWYLAVGLLALLATALAMPPLTRGNPYCNHLCPHGAIQQLVRPPAKSRRHLSLSASWSRRLSYLAPMTLAIAYLVLLWRPESDVSGLEPFHAYLWPMAAVSSVVLCVATLLVSLRVPMVYCRLGCPTGFLLGYLRRTSASHRIGRFDIGLVLLLTISLIKVWWL
ncbi:FMN-binding protein [Aporhodopirellula aestuarii]|uniref:FMN-binding protein n=1 Tax=Aporhodopirellula aestuarii TaxID=2950107 RepID=A0ABT0U7K4_9BACT|nr:FMN-binding protein [Aporhodopirellula aestuarii]MCM2372398.1 FMN-binding protein [Aporhodopirellula aestuarii]